MSVLPYQEILKLCGLQAADPEDKETSTGPITPSRKGNIRSAGYDLRLGDKYHLHKGFQVGKLKVQQLDETKAATLLVPPNEVVIVTTVESLRMPCNLVGHLTLKLDLLLQGLIMANQSQVDAGYEGGLFILLYNLSNRDVSLQLGASILRLELTTLTADTERPYGGLYKNVSLAKVLKSRIESSLAVMRKEVDRSKKELFWTQFIGVAIIICTTLLSYFGPLYTRISKLEQQVIDDGQFHGQEISLYGAANKAELDSLKKEINELRKQVEDLKKTHAAAR